LEVSIRNTEIKYSLLLLSKSYSFLWGGGNSKNYWKMDWNYLINIVRYILAVLSQTKKVGFLIIERLKSRVNIEKRRKIFWL